MSPTMYSAYVCVRNTLASCPDLPMFFSVSRVRVKRWKNMGRPGYEATICGVHAQRKSRDIRSFRGRRAGQTAMLCVGHGLLVQLSSCCCWQDTPEHQEV